MPNVGAELRGRAIGVTIMAFFAVAWTGWGTGGHLPATTQLIVMLVAVALAVPLAVLAWRLARTVPPTGEPAPRNMNRNFGIILGVEWLGLFVVAGVLGATGHSNVIAAVICAGVGVHFFPMARLFAVPVYVATGVALVAIAAATFILAPVTSTPALWTVLPGVGAAITLYVTAALLLAESRRLASPSGERRAVANA